MGWIRQLDFSLQLLLVPSPERLLEPLCFDKLHQHQQQECMCGCKIPLSTWNELKDALSSAIANA